jgi:hypothetical protein
LKAAAIICAFGPFLLASAALACEPPIKPPKDPRIKTQADCSFTEGQGGYFWPMTAGPAVKIGAGKFAQKLTSVYDGGLCGIELERLLVVDCDAVEDVLFDGRHINEHVESGTEIASIQPPKGPLALTASATLASLKTKATRAGIEFEANSIAARAAETKRRNRFNPYCGCKLHYPDSAGAE